MARKGWLPTVFVYLMIELGALCGVPVRLDQIEQMTRLLHQTPVVKVARGENNGDDDPPD